MDALKAQFERIRQQLAALTGTQKMLVAALVAIMVLTIMYWGKYAQNAEMVSLLGDQVLTADDIGPIDKQLDISGVSHPLVNGKIMVPADRQANLLADLMYARLLPNDTHTAFETMSKTLTPFSTQTEREASYNQATANDLSDIIGRFRGVASARVVLNSKNVERVEGGVPPSASVFIETRGEPEDLKGLVQAAAEGVAHAVSGLTPSHISVIVNGISKKVADASSGLAGSDEANELRKSREAELEQKIRTIMMIEGLSVAVNCEVDTSTKDTTDSDYDKKKSLVLPEHTTSETLETVSNNPTSHEPGVAPNTGGPGSGPASIDVGGGAAASASPNTTSSEKTSADNKVFASGHQEVVHTPAGKDKVISAAVSVPLSHFAKLYRLMNPGAAAPDEKTLEKVKEDEFQRIKESIKNTVALKADDAISVGFYADTPIDTTSMAAAVATSPLTTVKGNAKEIGVGVLAIVSLLMMAMMVRKSSPPPLVVAGTNAGNTAGDSAIPIARSLASLGSGEDIAGEVGAGNAALDAVEMDDDAVRTQQVLQQVSTMVKENPDGAATLVKRWLTRGG
jgi:flagellar biosynthesis/type III secretory pathway M-ring protein FliF/YscJ